ncbi:MAG TPA: right-handed parallel beta-helix repeat-containing protein [Pirellulales bacterium]|jgi:hypothetical protein|nr:right-handed parallel beta-helix repeat-containing protein [Pirellulales bacterium]
MNVSHWLRGRRTKTPLFNAAAAHRRSYRTLGFEPLEGRRLLVVSVNPLLVTTTSDAAAHSGVSLRDAIGTANADALNGQSETITFGSNLNGQTIKLAQGQLELGQGGAGIGAITINGGGQITIDGNAASSVFQVDAGVTAALTGLTIADGSASVGGGINNAGTLAVNNSTISGNIIDSNGGAGGEGIYNSGTMAVSNSTITGNIARTYGSSGGGIDNVGSMTVSNSTIANNTSYGYYGAVGGGINNSGSMTISNSTISGNYDSGHQYTTLGGGINNSGTLTVSNSTISGNTAAIGYNSGSFGGGIANSGALTISNSTISANAGANVGGVYNTSSATLLNSIVAGNTFAYGGGVSDFDGAIAIGSTKNLIGDGTGMTGISDGDANGNQVGTTASPIDPLLGALAGNGGAMQTMALQSGSPAINAGGAITTLAASINATATSFSTSVLTNYAAIASTPGTYVIQVDSEQIEIIGYIASTGTVTVVRGYNGTTAASHSSGAGVLLPFDERGIARSGAADVGAFEYLAIPAIGNLGLVTYVVGNGPTAIAAGASASAGANGLAGSQLTVGLSANAGSGDTLTLAAGGGVTFATSSTPGLTQVLYNGSLVGWYSAGSASTPLVVQFNSTATAAAVQAVLDDVVFYNANTSASAYDRTATFKLTDSKSVSATPVTETIHVIKAPPAIGNLGPTANYTAGSAAISVAGLATVTAGVNGMANSKLVVSLANSGNYDVMTIAAGNGVTINTMNNSLSYGGQVIGYFGASSGSNLLVVQFTSLATVASVQAVVDDVVFSNLYAGMWIYDRSVSFQLTDSQGFLSAAVSKTIHVAGVPPAVSNLGTTTNYTVGSGATVIAGSATVSGANDLENSRLVVSIANSGSNDTLVVSNGNGITVLATSVQGIYALVYNNSTLVALYAPGSGSTPLVVQFLSSATIAAVQAVTDDIAYYNTNSAMSVYDRTVSFALTDGLGNTSTVATKTIHVGYPVI